MAALFLRDSLQVMQRFLRRFRDENIAAGLEELVKTGPGIGDNRCSAGGGFEQANAWGPAGANHVGSRDIQRETLCVVKGAMLRRRQVWVAPHVLWPSNVSRILRPRYHEPAFGPTPRGLQEEFLERR